MKSPKTNPLNDYLMAVALRLKHRCKDGTSFINIRRSDSDIILSASSMFAREAGTVRFRFTAHPHPNKRACIVCQAGHLDGAVTVINRIQISDVTETANSIRVFINNELKALKAKKLTSDDFDDEEDDDTRRVGYLRGIKPLATPRQMFEANDGLMFKTEELAKAHSKGLIHRESLINILMTSLDDESDSDERAFTAQGVADIFLNNRAKILEMLSPELKDTFAVLYEAMEFMESLFGMAMDSAHGKTADRTEKRMKTIREAFKTVKQSI